MMDARTPFLKQVAQVYVDNERENIADYCFVVPNKRSAVFLSKYFSEVLTADGTKAALVPAIITISDFIGELSDKVELSRIEMLFILYEVYSGIVNAHLSPKERVAGKGLVDFNRFQYWGDILINDFGDVDRYLVDAAQLFRNIEGLKEISANYLTEEQLEVIRKYWNEDLVPEPVKEFWNHAVYVSDRKGDKSGHKNVSGFVKLWQVMQEVYDGFRCRLAEKGYGYSGMIYREVAERLKEMDADDMEFDRYVFVGFSVLSESEQSIFKSMQGMDIADFYWDYASPAMRIKGNRASRFIHRYVRMFPSRYRIGLDPVNEYPDINIVSVPSTFGQAKAIVPILRRIYPEKFVKPGYAGADADRQTPAIPLEQTAIVLPDENMVSPLLSAIPSEIETVNVTMGFPLNHTVVASLIKNIVSLQLRARELKSLDTFFFEDVIAVLSHPLIRSRYAAVCDKITAAVNYNHLFNVPVTFFDNEEYAPVRPIFSIVKNLNDSDSVINYLDDLMIWLAAVVSGSYNNEGVSSSGEDDEEIADGDDEGDSAKTVNEKLELQYILAYRSAIAELRRLNDRYLAGNKLFLEDKTVFHLAERILGNQTIAYEGMPLKGLQVMGVLESRGLDFDNIVITSMNERIFPRKHYARTFIPNALRRGYGMSTIEHQESMYAYYFYRLIARAKNVYLLYDGRTTGLRSGDMSRYINQIRYQFPASKIHFSGSQYSMNSSHPEVVSVEKTPAVMKELRRFLGGDNPRFLSAHALNTYIRCPLQFYLSTIERYYPEKEIFDFMDEGTYGTIVHEVAEKIYLDLKGDKPSLPLTPEIFEKLADKKFVEDYVARSIRKNYLNLPEDDPRPLHGDAVIFLKVMTRTLLKMFRRESEMDNVEFLSGEESLYVNLKVNDKYTIALNYRIDRIDTVNNPDGTTSRRIIDYKTGRDETYISSLAKLFTHGKEMEETKAIFQLLLYCNAYAQKEKYDGAIQPFIYKLRKVAVQAFSPLRLAKENIMDYRDLNDEFLQHLSNLLDEIYNPEIPFRAYPEKGGCKYCKFQELCSVD